MACLNQGAQSFGFQGLTSADKGRNDFLYNKMVYPLHFKDKLTYKG